MLILFALSNMFRQHVQVKHCFNEKEGDLQSHVITDACLSQIH